MAAMTPVTDHAGKINRCVGVNFDITERKQAEGRLLEYEKAMEGLEEMICVVDREYRYVLANRAFLNYRGLKREQLVGHLVREILNPSVFETVVKEKLDECFQGKVVSYELTYNYPHLGDRNLLISYFPIEGPLGVDRLACVLQDITERKKAQDELVALKDELTAELAAMTRLHEFATRLLESGEQQELLEEVLSATIALQKADFGNLQLYNPHTQSLEIVAQHGFRQEFLDHFASVPEDSAACGRALRDKERVIIEDVQSDSAFAPHRQIAAAAGYRAVQSTPLFSRSGQPLGMISTHFRQPHRPSERELRFTDFYARQASDMIERKLAEQALQESQATLTRVARIASMGELTTSIAHEVNQPLTAIVTNSNFCLRLLDGAKPNPADLREAIAEIVNDGIRASAVISRIRALLMRRVPDRAELDINEVIQEVTGLVRSEVSRNRISLLTDLTADLRVRGDRVQLQQVLINLIMNGIEAMRTITDRPRELLINSSRHSDGVLVRVKDSGSGIVPGQADRIFEPFFTTKPEGIGMGLSISRSIIESHGGRLWAVAGLNGALFEFTLPAQN